jgi:hypothetical protein
VRREAEPPPPPLPRERKVGGRVRECEGERAEKKWARRATEQSADPRKAHPLERRKKADEVLVLLSFFLGVEMTLIHLLFGGNQTT